MTYLALFAAVVIGGLFAEFVNLNSNTKKHFATFSGAFLLAITVFHLIPEVFIHPSKDLALFIMIGVFIQILLEFFSKGIEHAHDHSDHGHFHHFSLAMFISISIHAFLEGAPLADNLMHIGHEHAHGHSHAHDAPAWLAELGNPLLAGIFIHKVPIAAILYSMMRASDYSRLKSAIILLIFGLMSPLGSFLAHELEFIAIYATQISAIVIGIFLHISTTILFESDKDHNFNIIKLFLIVLATAIVYFSY
jgi:hypothetical protein